MPIYDGIHSSLRTRMFDCSRSMAGGCTDMVRAMNISGLCSLNIDKVQYYHSPREPTIYVMSYLVSIKHRLVRYGYKLSSHDSQASEPYVKAGGVGKK